MLTLCIKSYPRANSKRLFSLVILTKRSKWERTLPESLKPVFSCFVHAIDSRSGARTTPEPVGLGVFVLGFEKPAGLVVNQLCQSCQTG